MRLFIRSLFLLAALVFLMGSNGCPFDIDGLIEGTTGDVDGLTHKDAEWVIGQDSLEVVETGRTADADTIRDPIGLSYSGNRLFLADLTNNRVMVYRPLPEANNEPADFVLGQESMTDSDRERGEDGMARPSDVLARSWGLAVSDSDNDRVLIYSSLPSSGSADPSRVFGQPDLDSDLGSACSDDGLNQPWGLALADDRILVSDHSNHRIMIWDRNDPSGSGAEAVLGQFDFFSCNSNGGDSLPAGDPFNRPSGIWSDGNRLAVADKNNHRVLIWDSFPESGEPADVVLGQQDMNSNDRNAGGLERGMRSPTDVFWSNGRLFVADRDNHRVLVYSGWPSRDHQRPNAVIGQPDRESNQANNTGDESSVNGRGLRNPEAVWADQRRLLVSDTGNDRVLKFSLSD